MKQNLTKNIFVPHSWVKRPFRQHSAICEMPNLPKSLKIRAEVKKSRAIEQGQHLLLDGTVLPRNDFLLGSQILCLDFPKGHRWNLHGFTVTCTDWAK